MGDEHVYLEHPVDAWGRAEAHGVVDDYVIIIGDAQLADLSSKLFGSGHHVWKSGCLVLDVLDIKVACCFCIVQKEGCCFKFSFFVRV